MRWLFIKKYDKNKKLSDADIHERFTGLEKELAFIISQVNGKPFDPDHGDDAWGVGLEQKLDAALKRIEVLEHITKSEMKTIIVKWVAEEEFGYGKAMRVIESDHVRFTKGTRFDFGFMDIATDEGYTIISLPMEHK